MPGMEHHFCFCNQEGSMTRGHRTKKLWAMLQWKVKASLPCLPVTLISLAVAATSGHQSLTGYRHTDEHFVQSLLSLNTGRGPFSFAFTINRSQETVEGSDTCPHLSPWLAFLAWASLIAQLVKSPPVMQETLVWFLGREDLLEKGWATPSSILGLPLWLSW